MTAQEIFQTSFNFKSMKELNEAIIEDKKNIISIHWSRSKNVIVGSGFNSILVCHPKGGRIEEHHLSEPMGTKATITKGDIMSAIETVIEAFEGNPPAFDLCSDSQLYFYESNRAKLEGEEAEPTGEYYGTTILSYQPKITTAEISDLDQFEKYCQGKGLVGFSFAEIPGDGFYIQTIKGWAKVQDFTQVGLPTCSSRLNSTNPRDNEYQGRFEWARLSFQDCNNSTILNSSN